MDELTHKYYENNANSVFERYESVNSGISEYFQASFPIGSIVVDVGAGSARDLRHLISLGYNASGIEPSNALRSLAISKYPELEDKLLSGMLPTLTYSEQVDGIVCSAVLMHLPENLLFDSLLSLRDALKISGRLLVSIPKERPGLNEYCRDNDGRLFNPIEADRLILLAERLGLSLISRWYNTDSLKRIDHDWITLLFEKSNAIGRPLDRIQRVLSRDKKVATYKLALLRGFCDISNADDRVFDWSLPGKVGIPIELMIERWLFYYWPIIASPKFVPQIRTEPAGKPLKFRNSLNELVTHYRTLGGLDAFAIDFRSGNLSSEAQNLLKIARSDIRGAIVTGPIKHAEQGEMFSYNKNTKCIYCESNLWKEFCLTGYWIQDALILRWAELTSKLSSGLIVGEILGLLLIKPVVEREVAVARKCYLKQTTLLCVWSGQHITSKQLAVDHVLPFSLWGNNDLWNLLPSESKINGKKSDKIPTGFLLEKQHDLIVDNWQRLNSFAPKLFSFELNRVLGNVPTTNWETPLFDYLKRSCEYSIHIRGAEAWNGVNTLEI
ncbi:MAG: HNH endonuclease domain-containing protein [Thiohalomonadales bacterium]